MTQENLVLTQFACIFIFWAGLRFAILKKPMNIFQQFCWSMLVGAFAGNGILLYVLLSKNASMLLQIKWSVLYFILSIASVIAIPFVLYAGIMLIARICALCLESLHECWQRHR